MKISITEQDGTHRQWYDEARQIQNLDQLHAFMARVVDGYLHDYGTVVHAVTASALAAAWCANHMEGSRGGLTGFQGGCVMWGFIQNWDALLEGKPLRLVNYDNMLFPQYGYKFDKTISPDVWRYLQDEAVKRLAAPPEHLSELVLQHWRDIADGTVPFGYTVEAK